MAKSSLLDSSMCLGKTHQVPLVPVCVLSCFSYIRLFATLWTVAHEAPLSTGFSRQDYWTGLPCPSSENLPNPGIKPTSFLSPVLVGGFLTTSTTCEAQANLNTIQISQQGGEPVSCGFICKTQMKDGVKDI